MDNLEKLITAGQMAYGKNWQSPISRVLNISDRTVRNFVSGKSLAPVDLSIRLVAAFEKEIAKFQAAIDFVQSDKMDGENVSIELISDMVGKFQYRDEQDRKSAIDAVNNAVDSETWLSDLEETAKRFAIKK